MISIDIMREALRNTLGKKGMSDEDVKKLARYVINFFGYNDEIIDNKLTSVDRDVFYTLEEEGLLTTRREEVHLKKGKLWRIHYWILNKNEISRLANMKNKKSDEEDYSIYKDEKIWKKSNEE